MSDDLELLSPELRESVRVLNVPQTGTYACVLVRTELLRLARENRRLELMPLARRAQKAEAELAALRKRIDDAPRSVSRNGWVECPVYEREKHAMYAIMKVRDEVSDEEALAWG